jgi:hypothetical protein
MIEAEAHKFPPRPGQKHSAPAASPDTPPKKKKKKVADSDEELDEATAFKNHSSATP